MAGKEKKFDFLQEILPEIVFFRKFLKIKLVRTQPNNKIKTTSIDFFLKKKLQQGLIQRRMSDNKKRDASHLDEKKKQSSIPVGNRALKEKVSAIMGRVEQADIDMLELKGKIANVREQQELDIIVNLFLSFYICVKEKDSRANAVLCLPLHNSYCKNVLLAIDPKFDFELLQFSNIGIGTVEHQDKYFRDYLNSFVPKDELDAVMKNVVIRCHSQNSANVDKINNRAVVTLPKLGTKTSSPFAIPLKQMDVVSCKADCFFQDEHMPPSGWNTGGGERVMVVASQRFLDHIEKNQ